MKCVGMYNVRSPLLTEHSDDRRCQRSDEKRNDYYLFEARRLNGLVQDVRNRWKYLYCLFYLYCFFNITSIFIPLNE